jgi:hypothetical protein
MVTRVGSLLKRVFKQSMNQVVMTLYMVWFSVHQICLRKTVLNVWIQLWEIFHTGVKKGKVVYILDHVVLLDMISLLSFGP